MKVCIKRKDYQNIIPAYFAMAGFLGYGIFVFNLVTSADDIVYYIVDNLLNVIFTIFFVGLDIFFVIYMFKKPKEFTAQLISKEEQNYKGQQITYMTFKTAKETSNDIDYIETEYKCYTKEPNNLVVNQIYLIGIKEFNWQMKYVKDYQVQPLDPIKKVPKMNMSFIYLVIGGFFGITVLGSIIGCVLYPQYLHVYIIAGSISSVPTYYCIKGAIDNK